MGTDNINFTYIEQNHFWRDSFYAQQLGWTVHLLTIYADKIMGHIKNAFYQNMIFTLLVCLYMGI